VGQGSTFHFTARFGSGPHAENGSAWPAASVAGTESGDDASSPTPTDIIFDRNAVLEQLGDDHALLAEIAGLFLVDLPRWLDQIQQAIRATDTDALLNTAHTLKGALGGLYAQAGGFHPLTLHIPLLQARQNLFRVRRGTDLGKGPFDPALFVDQIRETAGKTGVASAVSLAQYRLGITQQRKLETVLIGKGLVRLNPIKTHAENLYIVLDEHVIMVTEPVPFRRSSPRARFGVKPEQHFLAPKVR
jgi:hypothetical protein